MTPKQAREKMEKRLKAYRAVFTGPNGQAVLDDLTSQFGGTSLKKVDGEIDVNATLAAAGAREVVLYIKQCLDLADKVQNDVVD